MKKTKKDFIKRNAHKLFLLAVFFIILDFTSRVPYLNILVTLPIKIITIWLVAVVYLKLKQYASYMFALLMLFIVISFVLIRRPLYAEWFAFILFFILIIGLLQSLIAVFQEELSKKNL